MYAFQGRVTKMSSLLSKLLILLFMLICAVMLLSCSSNQAEELFKTAEFEELQNNREHARQLYEDIMKNYPESDYAGKAEARLSDLKK